MTTPSDKRASCWSITINNPTDDELKCHTPGWTLQGQFEQGDETGTRHFQGMLKTPQVRFAAVKRVFPRAHIEVSRNPKALEQYVHKSETRVGEYAGSAVPNMFQFQDTIASDWDPDEFTRRTSDDTYCRTYGYDINEMALVYVDELVAKRVAEGGRGLEFIGINPMWRSSWKKFWRSIITRHALPPPPVPPPPPPSGTETPEVRATCSSGREAIAAECDNH